MPAVDEPNVSTGVVTGTLNASDPDGDSLVFTAPTVTDKGTVGINSSTGAFTYTPTVAARQNAAAPGATDADRQDTFAVTISDGHGGTTTAAVRVQVGAASEPAPSWRHSLEQRVRRIGHRWPGWNRRLRHEPRRRRPRIVAVGHRPTRRQVHPVQGQRVIDAQIHLTNGDVTIAGQTSPGGITLRGFVTDESPYQDQAVRAPTDFAENWILQHIRSAPVPPALATTACGCATPATRSSTTSPSATPSTKRWRSPTPTTSPFRTPLIAETLGGHAFYGGVLMNYSNPAYGFGLDNVSLHHNVFNRIEGRLPEGSRESAAAAGSFMNLELSNNLYWDPRFFIALGVDTAVAGAADLLEAERRQQLFPDRERFPVRHVRRPDPQCCPQ